MFQGSYYTRANGPPPELAEIDRDGDGLHEVLLEGGHWVGWSAAMSAFVEK